MNKIVYTDEKDLRIYKSMPADDFKEFFMAYFNYKKGDNVTVETFTNPMTYAMFLSYIPKLDKNEDTYNTRIANGKKGGRPRKNIEIENKAILNHQNSKDDNLYHPIEESGLNSLKMANNKEFEIEVNERKSIPTVKIDNTSVKPTKNTQSFQDVVKAYSNQINDIINDFKDGGPLRKMQGETRMSELLNTRAGKIYREEITNLINERVKSSIIEQGISPVEQVQELINNDDNFYRVFTNCVKMLSSDEPQESATNKLISLFNEYNVPYNKQVRDFIAEEIYYHINNKDEYAA